MVVDGPHLGPDAPAELGGVGVDAPVGLGPLLRATARMTVGPTEPAATFRAP